MSLTSLLGTSKVRTHTMDRNTVSKRQLDRKIDLHAIFDTILVTLCADFRGHETLVVHQVEPSRVNCLLWIIGQLIHLTESVYKVVLQESISEQVRKLDFFYQ